MSLVLQKEQFMHMMIHQMILYLGLWKESMGHQNMLFMVGLNGLIHLLEPKRGIYYSDLTVFLLTCNKTYMEIFMVTEKKLVFIMKVAIQIIHVIINLMKQNLQQIILIGILIITLLKQRKLIGIFFYYGYSR